MGWRLCLKVSLRKFFILICVILMCGFLEFGLVVV